MAPKQDRAAVTRQRIISAGVEMFDGGRYGITDMIDVIGRAGVSKGACYYHFPTKDSLATAIIEESNSRIAAAIAPVWESETPNMHRLINATFRFLELTETDDTVRVGYLLFQAMRPPREPGTTHPGDSEVLFTAALKGAVREGHVRPGTNVRQAAYTLFAALVGCRMLAQPFGHNPMERFLEVWQTLLRTIAAEEHLPALLRVARSASRMAPATS